MRGVNWFVGLVAIVLAATPAAVIIGRGVHARADVDWTPVAIITPIAIVGFLACRALRAAASRRYVETAIQRGRVAPSSAFAYTLVAWVLVDLAGALALGTLTVDRYDGTSIEDDVGIPLTLQIMSAVLALFGAAGYYSWVFRRRYEIPALEAAGVARLVEPPRKLPKMEALKLRSLMWLRGMVIDALLFAGAILSRLVEGDRPTWDEIGNGMNLVVGGPGIVSFALLVVMLVLGFTRRSAFDALRQPSSLAAIGIFTAGYFVQSAGHELAAGICAFVAVLIASATCMNIMDRGSQPWLGFVFLVGNYVYGYLTAPDGDTALPTGVTGLGFAILAAAYTAHQARSHWRAWTRLVPLADDATPQQP
ncbi:MAG TPA: hypothetical protein VE465_00815 [Streptosporangiaceae bacterium]|jgi:hypothetical protein|nr:hypothetical protein [Streptosporangiaceae bacterium]